MTHILGIDTSTDRGRVAAVESVGGVGRTVAELDEPMPLSHATHLLTLIDRVFIDAGWSKDVLDGIAVVRGPGSFTGVRIALGSAEGLALASDCPCVGVNTLEAMAEASGACLRQRVCVLGAGREELYCARFDPDASPPTELAAPALVDAATFWCEPTGYVLWGARAEPPAGFPREAGRAAAAGTAAAAARIALARGSGDPRKPLSPLYVRPSDAEIKRRGR